MDDIYSSFNRKLRELVELVKSECSDDVIVDIDRRIKLAIMTDKSLLLTEGGQDLYKLRKEIMNDEWDQLINTDWETEIDKNNFTIDDMDVNTMKYTIRILKKVWDKLNSDDQNKIKSILKRLVSNYAKWLVAQK